MQKLLSVVIVKSENKTSVRFTYLTHQNKYYPSQASLDRLMRVLALHNVGTCKPIVGVYTDVIILKYEV